MNYSISELTFHSCYVYFICIGIMSQAFFIHLHNISVTTIFIEQLTFFENSRRRKRKRSIDRYWIRYIC